MLWLAVVVFAAIVFGFNALRNNPGTGPIRATGPAVKTDSAKTTPVQTPLQKILGLIPHKNQAASEGLKIYRNTEYEFEFTYPASFGEVAVKNYECPPGFVAVGTFGNNPHIDFGFSTSDYQKCKDFSLDLFETRTFDLADKKLKLYSSDPTALPLEVVIEQTIPIPTPNIVAYIIGKTGPAAILRSPNPKIGPLIFRTHGLPYDEGVKLLEAIIK